MKIFAFVLNISDTHRSNVAYLLYSYKNVLFCIVKMNIVPTLYISLKMK